MNEETQTVTIAQWKARQIQLYQGLANKACELNESWVAFNAQVAATWLALQFAVVRTSSDDESPEDLHEFLNDVWRDAFASVEECFLEHSEVEVSDLVEAVYRTIARKLDAHAWSFVTELLAPSSDFAGLTLSEDSLNNHFAHSEFGNASTALLVSRKAYEAKKLYKEFYMLADESKAAAVSALYQADMLMFEAWVLQRSEDIGDDSRVFAAIQLSLANAYLQQLAGVPVNLEAYEASVRGSFARAIGPDDASDLAKAFAPIFH